MDKQIDDCIICLLPLDNDKDNITVNCCKKQFHTICYIKWMQVKVECAHCRYTYNKVNKVNNNIIIDIPATESNNQITNSSNKFGIICCCITLSIVILTLIQTYIRI